MNDPGLDRPIADVSNEVDGQAIDGTQEEDEDAEERAYLDPRSG